jgi:cyclohexa-1,5-dienecarbonyl-CoA hydratase
MGLLTELAEPEEFENILDNLLTEIKHCSPLIIRLNKKAVNQHLGMDLDAAVDGVGDLFLKRLMATEDTLEGIRSFEEKRRPQWKNR